MFVSKVLLKVKSAATVVLGRELNKDAVFEVFVSCFDGVKEGNQEEAVWLPAVVPSKGVNLKSDSVFVCVDAVKGLQLNIDDDSVLDVDLDNPKNDLDVLASVLTYVASTEPTAGVGCMFCVSAASCALTDDA